MIGIIIAVLVAALVYALCLALGLPSIVAIIAAILVLAGRHPVRRLRPGQPLWRPRQALTQSPGGGRAAASRGRPGPVIEAGDFKRAFQRFQKDEMTQRAAALTYYSLLSLFPALLFGVAVLGVFGQEGLVHDAADYLKTAGAPPATVDAVTSALAVRPERARHRARGAGARPGDRALRRVRRVRGGRVGAQPGLARAGGARRSSSTSSTTSRGRSC